MESAHILPGTGSDPVLEALNARASNSGEEITQDDAFSYDGYQVVRREFFADQVLSHLVCNIATS